MPSSSPSASRRRSPATPISEIPTDAVAFTSPAAGTSLGSGDTVGLYQSTGYVPPPPKKGNKGKGGRGNGGKGRG